MSHRAIYSDHAPKAIGPYSHAVQAEQGKITFLSGQIPINPQTGEVVQGDAAVQTQRVMENLKAVLDTCGLKFSNVVRCGLFLIDLNDFAKVNEVYGRYFQGAPPARATVQVAALPGGARVEIEAIAVS